MARRNAKIEALERAVNELRQAPLFEKTVYAERVASLSIALFDDLERRLESLELHALPLDVRLARAATP